MTIFVTRLNGALYQFSSSKKVAIEYGEEIAFANKLKNFEVITWTQGTKLDEAKADTYQLAEGKIPRVRR